MGSCVGVCLGGFLLRAEATCGFRHVTKASEASWSYSCDSKVSFDRVQILTPDLSGRSPPLPPPLPTSPLLLLVFLHLPSLPPSSLFASSTPFDSVLSSLFGMRLALRILQPHSLTLTLTLTLTVSLSLSLSLSSLSSLSHLSLISLSSLSHLSLISLSSLSLSLSLSSLAGGSGQRATYKGLFTWNRLPRPTCARRPAFCYSVQTRCYQSLFGFEMYL